jgi:hypothetical protein
VHAAEDDEAGSVGDVTLEQHLGGVGLAGVRTAHDRRVGLKRR